MARIDDYSNAKKIAAATLMEHKFETIAQNSELTPLTGDTFRLDFLDRSHRIKF